MGYGGWWAGGMRCGMGEMECVHGASVLDYGWQYSVYRDEMGYG